MIFFIGGEIPRSIIDTLIQRKLIGFGAILERLLTKTYYKQVSADSKIKGRKIFQQNCIIFMIIV